MTMLAGIDIGGKKCSVSVGLASADGVRVLGKHRFANPARPTSGLNEFIRRLQGLIVRRGPVEAVGVSCGSPLGSRLGIIDAPSNLPGWKKKWTYLARCRPPLAYRSACRMMPTPAPWRSENGAPGAAGATCGELLYYNQAIPYLGGRRWHSLTWR